MNSKEIAMKRKAITLFCICFLLTGCAGEDSNSSSINSSDVVSKGTEIEETNSIDVIGGDEPSGENSGENTENTDISELTLDAVEMLSAKHETLCIEDFAPYLDLSPLREGGSLFETLEFLYKGETMYLRVSASDKDLALAPYEGDLDGAVVFQEDFLNLETLEQEYAYEGSCADIRSGNLQHILDGMVEMQDYITVVLPDGYTQSDYKYWMGSHGGVAFTKEDMIEDITIENAGIYADNPLPGGIEIWGNGELHQNVEVVSQLEPLEVSGTILQREILQTEQGAKWYVAYTEQEGSSISYCLYLNYDLFTEAEFLEVSDTIKLMPYAIY